MSHIHGVTRLCFPVSTVISFTFTTVGETSHLTVSLSEAREHETSSSILCLCPNLLVEN
jgi:hypothetical protein